MKVERTGPSPGAAAAAAGGMPQVRLQAALLQPTPERTCGCMCRLHISPAGGRGRHVHVSGAYSLPITGLTA